MGRVGWVVGEVINVLAYAETQLVREETSAKDTSYGDQDEILLTPMLDHEKF